MSKIDEMLKNEKVEWRKLGEVCNRQKGISITASKMKELSKIDGKVKIFAGGKTIAYLSIEDVGEENIITIPSIVVKSRGNIDFEFCNETFSHKNELWSYSSKNEKEVSIKFLYYYLKTNQQFFIDSAIAGKLPQIATGTTDNYLVPIPSIETQKKIVDILDKLTNHVTELQAELQFRTKQYEYYRDMLLSEDYLNKISEKIDKFENNIYKLSFTTLEDIVDIVVGGDVPRDRFSTIPTDKYRIPIYSNGIEEKALYGYTDIVKVEKTSVTISARGTIGYVSYREKPYYPIVRLICLLPSEKIAARYLYYLLQNTKIVHIKTGIPSLTTDMVRKIKVLLPPIEIQNKVVKVLDKFQTLLEDTKGLLPTEIEQRRKQYEYYREKLLTFDTDCGIQSVSQSVSQLISNSFFRILAEAADLVGVDINDNIDWKTLGSIGSFENGTGMPKTLFDEQGSVGLNTEYDIKKVLLKDIARYSTKRITAKFLNKSNYVGVDNLSKNKLGKVESEYVPTEGSFIGFGSGDILIGNIRPYLRKIWLANVEGGTNGDVLAISIKEDCDMKILPKFLYQILSSEKFFEYDIKFSKGAKMPRGNKDKVMNYEFMLPSIPVQEHIVSILDKFDTLVNDIKNGLPKEIELRQKQYEYFREKLLNFSK